MDLPDAIEPVTVLKTRSAELIRRARETRQPVIITQNGKATAVLQDVESYQRQRQALMLLKYVALGERDLRDGAVLSDADADTHFRDKLNLPAAVVELSFGPGGQAALLGHPEWPHLYEIVTQGAAATSGISRLSRPHCQQIPRSSRVEGPPMSHGQST